MPEEQVLQRHCPACLFLLVGSHYGEYISCPGCGSAVLVSPYSAEEDNAAYFENSYAYEAPISRFRHYLLMLLIGVEGVFRRDIRQNRAMTAKINQIAADSKRVLEVGFGNGAWLEWLLNLGVDAYGVDLSDEAVDKFRLRLPNYAGRVSIGMNFQGVYDLIYANALFEHLDQPDVFLKEAVNALADAGRLILGFPTVSEQPTCWSNAVDINFWVPCHRVLYSMQGLNALFVRYNLELQEIVSCDPYGYRVMNAFLVSGYDKIRTYRTPAAVGNSVPGWLDFGRALIRAVWITSPTRWTRVVLKRCTTKA